MKIKYCGLRRIEDAQYANETMPDYVGFIFAPTKRQITPGQAGQLRNCLKPEIQTVGVFVNEQPEVVAQIANQGILNLIQLHGQEDAEYIRKLHALLEKTVPLIKAVRVRTAEDIAKGQQLDVDYMLLDTYSPGLPGGTGESFNWELIKDISKPYFLAGGINLDNLEEAMSKKPFGIDISSGIETDGWKDLNKMRAMMQLFRDLENKGGSER